MRRLFAAGLTVLAIPVVAYWVATQVIAKYERDWQSMLAQRYAHVSVERRAELTLAGLCAKVTPEQRPTAICEREAHLAWMRNGAVAAGGVGIAWLLLIALAGQAVRGNRRLLLMVFGPGLRATAIVVVALIASHGALAVAAIFFGEAALVGRVHTGIILAIALGALCGVGAVAKATMSVVATVTARVLGKTVAASASPELWQFVRQTATAVGTPPPSNIVVGMEPNFFVTEAPVRCLDGMLRGRTLFLSLPLTRIRSRDELRGVLGHELGHYKGQDTEFSRKFYPVYRGTCDALAGLATSGAQGAGRIALWPAEAVLAFFLQAFAVAENETSRERELEADLVGADLVGVRPVAAALVKIHAFSRYWPWIREQMAQALGEGKAFTNLSAFFGGVVERNAGPKALENLDEQRLSHPTDSHPPLAVRLENLGVPLRAVQDVSLAVVPPSSGATLVADLESIEEELSVAEHAVLARSLPVTRAVEAAAEEVATKGSGVSREGRGQ